MKIYIDRSICDDCLSTCERRMARLVRYPLAEDRPCITAIEDDGQTELTLVIKDNGHQATLVLDDEARELVASEGFSAFLPWTPSFYRS
jgi:hypothetical protein